MSAPPFMPWFIPDYLADTAHLSTLEHGAYDLLIMNYWQREGPLPGEDRKLAAICKMPPAEWQLIRETIAEFFIEKCDGNAAAVQWHHKRIDLEIKSWRAKSWKAKVSAKARWDKDKNAVAVQTQSEGNARRGEERKRVEKKTPTESKKVARATRLPDDWIPSPETVLWAMKEFGFSKNTLYQAVLEFRDYWCALGGQRATKIDWNRTFKNRVRQLGKQTGRAPNGKVGFGETAKRMIDEGRNLEMGLDAPEQPALPPAKRV